MNIFSYIEQDKNDFMKAPKHENCASRSMTCDTQWK